MSSLSSSQFQEEQVEFVDVIIIGSGPTGLMLACQLALHGIQFRIYDRAIDHTTQSRALAIHARSLEIFQQMGIAYDVVNQGEVVTGFTAFFNGVQRVRFNMNMLRTNNLTKFPFVLILEQSKTEKLLETFLSNKHNIEIQRQCELIDFIELNSTDDGDQLIECTIRDYRQSTEGKLIKIRTRYLCGCDGAHSRVREHLNMSFLGTTYETSLYVLDCHLNFLDDTEQLVPQRDMQFNLTNSGLTMLFPMKTDDSSNKRWRVIATLSSSQLQHKQLEFEDVEPDFSQRIQRPIELYDPLWISLYRSHHRYVESFSHENKYFLLGDAAHIHSPVGGQGMNTGLQDAFNLAWKLAYTIQGKTTDNELLKTYNDERIETAKTLVHTTDRVFSFITSQNRILRFIRLYIVPFLFQFIIFPVISRINLLRNLVFKRLSMIGIQYRQSELSLNNNTHGKVLAGDRLPYIYTHSDDLLSIPIDDNKDDSRKYFHLLILCDKENDHSLSFIKFIQDYYSNIIKTHLFNYSNETTEIFRVFDVRRNSTGACFLIRPDLYIAYSSTTLDIQHFNSYLSKWFTKNN